MNTPLLEASKLKKVYKAPSQVEVLGGVNLALHPGQTVAIIGKSGEGKSTLLHILGSLDAPSSGSVKIRGKEIQLYDDAKLRNTEIGFVFQSANLLDEYTLIDNILMPAKIGGQNVKTGSSAHLRACELLDFVGLSKRASFLAKKLSGGEKQRGAIARALMNDPSLILADEPSGNLDHAHSKAIHTLLIDSVKRFQKGLIVVTHDPELASLCDITYRLRDGILESV